MSLAMYQLIFAVTMGCLVGCGLINLINWLVTKRPWKISKKNPLGFRRLLIPNRRKKATASIPRPLGKLLIVRQWLVCGYVVLTVSIWINFHIGSGHYYREVVERLASIFL